MDSQNAQGAAAGFRLSPQQEGLWEAEPHGPAGRVQCAVALAQPVDAERILEELKQLIARHEALRTTFMHVTGFRMPQQVVREQLEPAWEVVDTGAGLVGALEDAAAVSLDLERGPTVGGTLVQDGEDVALVLTVLRPCADEASLLVLARELLARLTGQPEGTDGDPLQYADFAEWRAELLSEAEEHRPGQSFWSSNDPKLLPATRLPFHRTPPVSAAGRVELTFPAGLMGRLDGVAARFDAETAELLEACWHAFASRVTGETEIVVGRTSPGRTHEELGGAVGPFALVLPVRSSLREETSAAELLDQVRRAREEVERWEDYLPVESLVAFEHLPLAFTCSSAEGAASGRILRLTATDPVGIELALLRSEAELSAELRHDGAYEHGDVERFASQFVALLEAVAADPAAPIAELRLLPPDVFNDPLLEDVNRTAREFPAATVHQLFRDQVARTPDAVAVISAESSLTYAQLDERANRLAHRLVSAGIVRNDAVALCTDRSVDMVVGLLGILKAGAGYVPLNFEHPQARLEHQLRETGAKALVTQAPLIERLPSFAGSTIALDRDADSLAAEPADEPAVGGDPSDLVYVLYTSGSTGLPKGVGVTHSNLVNYTTHMLRKLAEAGPVEGAQFGVVSAISTDLGNTAVFPCLLGGGSLHLISPETSMDSGLFSQYVAANPLDILKITPSHLRSLLAGREPDEVLPRRWLVLGGEAASWELVSQAADGSRRVLNHYGPTETTVGSCTFEVTTGAAHTSATVPIGKPIANTHVYVLDRRGVAVPVGVPGELLIGGMGVSRGYVDQPEQTAVVFVQEPGASDASARAYRTGDRARLHPDGTLEFLGRIDQQVKIRGFRVEPGEIEAALLRHPDVEQVAVVPRGEGEDVRFVAYLVGADGLAAEALREFLHESLPDYMVPSTFALIPAFPLTPSGKIDRLALPDERAYELARTETYVAPRTPVEEELAAIWADVLGVDRVGATDDFFALGGHSLIATQVIARTRLAFDVDLPLHALFTSPTVGELAAALTELRATAGDDDVSALLDEVEGLSEDEVGEALLEGSETDGRPPN